MRVAAQGFVWLQSSTPRVSDSEKLGLDEKRNMSEKILEDFGAQCQSVRLCYEVLISCIEGAMSLSESRTETKWNREEKGKEKQIAAMTDLSMLMRLNDTAELVRTGRSTSTAEDDENERGTYDTDDIDDVVVVVAEDNNGDCEDFGKQNVDNDFDDGGGVSIMESE